MDDNVSRHVVVPGSTTTNKHQLLINGEDTLRRSASSGNTDVNSASVKRCSARLASGRISNNEPPADVDSDSTESSNIATRTRNSKVVITCSDYGTDRALKYKAYHFCRPCEAYDERILYKSKNKKKSK